MALNIIDLIKSQLGPTLISQFANQSGESESGITKAISGLLPTVLGGLAHHANNSAVTQAIGAANNSNLLSDLLGDTSNNSIITTLLSKLFGDKLSGIVSKIAEFAGISNSSSNSLLHLVTGATLGSVGKYAADNQLSANGISDLLKDHKGLLAGLLPAGLSFGSLGLSDMFSGAAHKVESAFSGVRSSVSSDNNNKGGGSGIWKWLLPILLIAAGWFIWKQCNKPKTDDQATTEVTTDSSATSTDTTTQPTTNTKSDVDIDLNGVTIKGYANGMEANMINFLKSGDYDKATNDDALKNTWYNFDKVNFKMGSSSELEDGSQAQLDNLVAILKAFPKAKIKIGGYTDKTGNEATNLKISQARAAFIKNALDKAGVGAQVISAEGYGSKYATVDASASDSARAVDRKMAVRFAK